MKRIIFSILLLCFGLSLSLFLYVMLEPDHTSVYSANIRNSEDMMSASVSTDNDDYIYSQVSDSIDNGISHFYFFSSADQNSQYLDLNVIKPLARSINLEGFDNIVSIDIASIELNEYMIRNLESEFSFSNYPVYMTIEKTEEGILLSDNILEYDETKPFSQTDIKNWMLDNDCWPGPAEEVATPIAQVED